MDILLDNWVTVVYISVVNMTRKHNRFGGTYNPIPDWLRDEIVRLSDEGVPATKIAERLGIHRHTVRKIYLESKAGRETI